MQLREDLTNHISTLPSSLVKEVLLRWVETSDFNVEALDEALKEQQSAPEEPIGYGEYDETLTLVPLTEQAMVSKSLEALANYRQTGHAIPHDQMKAWAASLGTAQEQPCPH